MKSSHNYPLLLVSQFLGAFGDNAILAVILGQLTYLQKAGRITEEALRFSGSIYTSLLFVPFIVLAPLAGYLNDRFPKTRWLAGGNALKILGTSVCALSVWHGYLWQGIGYFIVGIGSCFYGPAKYGILPEILPRERLVKANGSVELLSLVAILTGAIGGSVMADRWKDAVWNSYAVLLGVYGASLLLNLLMQKTEGNPQVRFGPSLREFKIQALALFLHPRLSRVVIGTALFWVCGAAMKINFQPWGLDVLHLPDNTQIALLGLWLSVGVMAGSILAGWLYRVGDLTRTRRYGVALATMMVLLFSVGHLPFWRSPVLHAGSLHLILPVVVLLVATGIIAGLFLIPLNAAVQAESDPLKMGKTIAAQNLADNIGMAAAGALCIASVKVGISASGVFLVLAVATASVVAWLRIPPHRAA